MLQFVVFAAESDICQMNCANTPAANAMTDCVLIPLTTIVVIVWNDWTIVFHDNEIHHLRHLCQEMV